MREDRRAEERKMKRMEMGSIMRKRKSMGDRDDNGDEEEEDESKDKDESEDENNYDKRAGRSKEQDWYNWTAT